MRGNTFLNMIVLLRNELARSSSVAVGVDDAPRLKHHLNRAYEHRYDKHDWPHLRRTFDKIALAAGQRYYDFPTELNYERIEKAWVWWTNKPVPIWRGISVNDYSAYDSANNERSDPVMKWDVRSIGTATQFEIWPLPASNSVSITFLGHRKIAKLINDIDVCYLDDWLVVLDAAASIEKDGARRQQRAAEAEDRYRVVTANDATGDEPVRLNMGPGADEPLKGVRIAVRAT